MLDNPEHESWRLEFKFNRVLLAARYVNTRKERAKYIRLILRLGDKLSMVIKELPDPNESVTLDGDFSKNSPHFFKHLALIAAKVLARLEDPSAAPERIPERIVSNDPF